MEITDIINLSVGVTSLILAVLAGALSIYFFLQTKKSEQSTSQLLENIKTQTENLQKLTGKWMEKLINYSTQTQPVYTDTLTTLVTLIQEIPSKFAGTVPALSGGDSYKQEMIAGYIGTYYYAALTNVAMQTVLATQIPGQFDILNPTHNMIKTILDTTSSDVQAFDRLLREFGSELTSNRAYNFFEITENQWLMNVKNFEAVYQEKLALSENKI